MENLKEGLVDKYLYNDKGYKFIGQVVKKDEFQYKTVNNFTRKDKQYYISMHNSKVEKFPKALQKIKEVPTDVFILIEKYNPLGKNLEKNYEEININKLILNSVNARKYLILKIISKIYINKSTNFICEDSNNDAINLSINDCEKYFKAKSFDMLENEIFSEGKYIIVLEPNYGIFESEPDIDQIRIASPNEIIILKDKDELNYFLDKHKNPTVENYKLLGNLMITKKVYEKALFYYTTGISLNQNKNNDNMDIILHSNLSEAYYQYGYFSKCIENADYCLNKVTKLKEKKRDDNKNDTFLIQQKIKNLFRKIKALVSLRKFKEAYEILFVNSETNPNKDILTDLLKLDQIKNMTNLIKNGYENTLGRFDFIKMLKEEKINFDLENKYGDYLNPKIEIKYEKGKGIKMCAKEKINIGELLIVEKSIVYSREEDINEKNDSTVSADNPKVIAELELFNKLALKLKKAPLDNEKFYYLTDGRNLDQDLNERKKYLEDQDKGKIDIEHFKVNQVICLNKYGNKRYIIYEQDLGAGLWGYPSFFNHDCLPNTNHFGIGDYYIGFSIAEIEKGEEITVTYCDCKNEYKKRQSTILENWRFKCCCQLCKYQEKKNDSEYNNYIKLFNDNWDEISDKQAKNFQEFLEKNKKKLSCYELANGYLLLQDYYYIKKRDFATVQKLSELISKYADGKNFSFQLTNLYKLFLSFSASNNNQCLVIYGKIINYLKKYSPLTEEEINFFIRNALNLS